MSQVDLENDEFNGPARIISIRRHLIPLVSVSITTKVHAVTVYGTRLPEVYPFHALRTMKVN